MESLNFCSTPVIVCIKSESDKDGVADGTEPRKGEYLYIQKNLVLTTSIILYIGDDESDKLSAYSNHKKVVVKPSYTFPLLNLKEMDKDEKERLHQRLFAESESMEDKFQALFKAT